MIEVPKYNKDYIAFYEIFEIIFGFSKKNLIKNGRKIH